MTVATETSGMTADERSFRTKAIKAHERVYAENTKYGTTDHGSGARQIIVDSGAESLLDVGCGDGKFCRWAGDMLPGRVVGMDSASRTFGIERVMGCVQEMPFGDNTFDVVTAFDVLEHVPENDVHLSLANCARVARQYMLFSICHRTSVLGLHFTVRPIEWWTAKIRKHGSIFFFASDGTKTERYIMCLLASHSFKKIL